MKNLSMMNIGVIALLVSTGLVADTKKINSLQLAEKIPGVKEIIAEGEKLQKTLMGQLKDIETKAQKLVAEIQKERTDLMAKRSTLNPDKLRVEEEAIQDKERKVQEMQGDYQRIMHKLENEMQVVQMKLQPSVVEVIQNAQEVASKNPLVDSVWDEATKQMIYVKESADFTAEVLKLTEKKNEQKTTVAKAKAPVKVPATKVA
jgi:Skp family chaperone for outer membrane proteins